MHDREGLPHHLLSNLSPRNNALALLGLRSEDTDWTVLTALSEAVLVGEEEMKSCTERVLLREHVNSS